jgi:hypothetical protein
MVRHVRKSEQTTQLLLAMVFACALLLRLAVPEGWMPAQTSHGWRLTICTGMGPLEAMPDMAMDHGANKGTPGNHDKAGSICPFAGLGLATAEPFTPPFPFIAPIVTATAFPLHDIVTIGRGLAAPPPPPTGPPAIA